MKEKRHTAILAVQFALCSAVLAVLWLDDGLFIALSREDSLVEYLTALLFLMAAGLAVAGACRAHRAGLPRLSTAGFILLALGMAFVGMEEISWGQRIFGWSTPERFAELNWQRETSLHNLATDVSQKAAFAASLVFGVCGVVALNLCAPVRRLYRRCTELETPGSAAVYCCLIAYAWCPPEWLLPTLNLVITVMACGVWVIYRIRTGSRADARREGCAAGAFLLLAVATRYAVSITGNKYVVEVGEQSLALAAFLLTAAVLPPRDTVNAPPGTA
jgi:hypothetical protein